MRAALILAAALAAGAAQAAEPSPTAIPADSYGQHLIKQALAQSPGVVAMTMYVTPPGGKDNVVVASNIGGIGRKADEDDVQVIATGRSKLGVNKAGDRFGVVEVLRDVSGDTVGALSVVFSYKSGDDQQVRRAQAEAIRDGLAKRVAHAGNLLDRWPYDPHFTGRTYAQALVDKTMAAYPEIEILAIHATPPGSKVNVILGSNIGRIGKKADEDDLRVIEHGSTNREVNAHGNRFEAELPLNDAHGKRIGALGVVFGYKAGDDKAALVRRAEHVRDEMAAQISSPAALARKTS